MWFFAAAKERNSSSLPRASSKLPVDVFFFSWIFFYAYTSAIINNRSHAAGVGCTDVHLLGGSEDHGGRQYYTVLLPEEITETT